jgi:topoisomerase-4 subunit A
MRHHVKSGFSILSSYISHKRDIIRSRSIFDRDKAEKRLHIVEGLIRVLSILDEVIALIRASDNKADARELDGILQL